MIETPVWKSEAFWSSIIGVLVIVLSSFVPEIRPQLDIIAPAVVVIIGVLIGKGAVVQVQAYRTQAEAYKAQAASAKWVNPPAQGEILDGRP